MCAGEMLDQTLPIASQLEQAVTIIKASENASRYESRGLRSASRKQVDI